MKNLYFLLILVSGIALGQPIIQQPTNLQICDNNNDGFASFDLSMATNEILGALNPASHTIGFFETSFNAINFVNSIPLIYYTNVPNIQTIYVGVYENSNPNLVATTSFEIIVNPTPMIWELQDLVIAESANDGVAVFDLTVKTPIIVNGQVGITVQYYISQADATSSTAVLSNSELYTNLSNPQRIWVRSENIATGCFSIGFFDLHVISDDFIVFSDANLKSRLLETATPYPTALDLDGNYLVIDATGDGEVQYGEALLVGSLYLSNQGITDMEGIQYFTNMTSLSMPLNSVTTLNVSALVNLQLLECYSNELVSLELGNVTSIESITCYNNNLTDLDISNQINLTWLWCFTNNLTDLDISQNTALVHLQCDQNQISELDLSTVNLEVLSCSQNQLSGIDLSLQTNLVSINCASNLFTELDLSTNTQLTWISCAGNFISTIDVSMLPVLNMLDTGGSLLETIIMKNGTHEEFVLAESPNLAFICVDDLDVAMVQSVVNGNLNLNTVVNTYCNFTPGGDYNTITGTVRFDANNNGCDASDYVFPMIKVGVSGTDGNGASFTNTVGQFTFYTQEGEYLVAPELENSNYFDVIVPVSVNFPLADNSTITQDFCIVANGVHQDLEVAIVTIAPARPGFDAVYKIVYKNKGNQVMTQLYGLSFFYNQNLMSLVSSVPAADQQSLGSVNYSFADLMPFESRSVLVTLHINAPTDANPVVIGDVLTFTASISPIGTDETQLDNYSILNQTVVGAYDPNDKTCIQGESVSPTMIGEYLYYVINFENIGTAEAQNVVVEDVIDIAQYDINSLQVVNTSHQASTRLEANVIRFYFNGIDLEPGGHGNILLKIKSKSTLVTGNTVSNKANIFFDYNHPIETNFANTTFESLGLNPNVKDAAVKIYPNPATDSFTVEAKSAISNVEIFDINGRILQKLNGSESAMHVNISSLNDGIYFIRIATINGVKIEQLIKK